MQEQAGKTTSKIRQEALRHRSDLAFDIIREVLIVVFLEHGMSNMRKVD